MVMRTDYKGKDKATTGKFLDLLYKKYIPSNNVVQEEINSHPVRYSHLLSLTTGIDSCI